MAVRARKPLPAAILNAPELQLGLELYYVAFLDLTTERQLGFSEGPIPWSSIERYASAWRLDTEQRGDLHFHVRALDVAYLEHRAKKSKVESSKPAAPVGLRSSKRKA